MGASAEPDAHLTLSLLMLRVLADDHDSSFSFDNLALLAHRFHRSTNLHNGSSFRFIMIFSPPKGTKTPHHRVNRDYNKAIPGLQALFSEDLVTGFNGKRFPVCTLRKGFMIWDM